MNHQHHRMHDNSLLTYSLIRNQLKGRKARIYEYIHLHGECTDRQIMDGLGFKDMNAVRPRITELIAHGSLIEVYSVRDSITKKQVRVVDLRREPFQFNFIDNLRTENVK